MPERESKGSDRRQDGLHRVQIGLTGLAGVILLVGLANIVIDKAQLDERTMPPPVVPTLNAGAENAVAPREPLAELGVTPSAEQSGQVVPDLQPDPALSKPMDSEPQ
ncbi:hypothetical protein BH11PSE5_BH11PSE5_09010 [soil metagenome]|jgi:hypothetical protein|uniref:hypothetical protein n=1 Tax=unclassified Sphingobium TaxID=2611147 RepID=UPI001E30FFE6|nr:MULTISPECIES: hypothetical protein [unclassified Sphingobium]GLI97913.1 hypothetical protein Sbs19_17310 [Sphingobium sp. BS19]CAH0349519.1 hypothetical protein SPH9361_00647 [Sphingobium sp. CECT 9361]|tara:strand:- start:356 stop:676 length:321 start_codon:yes stop_codon:yes gene_type:complete